MVKLLLGNYKIPGAAAATDASTTTPHQLILSPTDHPHKTVVPCKTQDRTHLILLTAK